LFFFSFENLHEDLFLECRHRFNQYYSWRNSLKQLDRIDGFCIDRSRNLVELMCLNEAIQRNVNRDQIQCVARRTTNPTQVSSQTRRLIIENLTIINGIDQENQQIKSIRFIFNEQIEFICLYLFLEILVEQ